MSGVTTELRGVRRRAGRLLVPVVFAVALLALPPLSQARTSAGNSLEVTFTMDGTITMALPDGTPVGTTSGAPTVIPAGSYVIYLQGPEGCVDLPFFILKGPGESITDNLASGASTNSYDATFQPNSTYTWIDDQNPKVVYTFTTSSGASSSGSTASGSSTSGGTVSGSVQATGSAGGSSNVHSTANVRKAAASTRGTLVGTVTPAGRLMLTLDGKGVKKLTAGRYRVSVVDRSSTRGFVLVHGSHDVTVTAGRFIGTPALTVSLTSGRWSLLTGAGAKPSLGISVG